MNSSRAKSNEEKRLASSNKRSPDYIATQYRSIRTADGMKTRKENIGAAWVGANGQICVRPNGMQILSNAFYLFGTAGNGEEIDFSHSNFEDVPEIYERDLVDPPGEGPEVPELPEKPADQSRCSGCHGASPITGGQFGEHMMFTHQCLQRAPTLMSPC